MTCRPPGGCGYQFCWSCRAKWTGYSHVCDGYTDANDLKPTDWNNDGGDVVATLGKPELRRWNHFFARITTHSGAKQQVEKRLDTLRLRALEMLEMVEAKRAEEEAAAAELESQLKESKEEGEEARETKTADGDAEEESKEVSRFSVSTIAEAHSNVVCTFNATGRMFVQQRYYRCETCQITQRQGVCIPCARTCHAGHRLSEVQFGSFYCDCGSGVAIKAPETLSGPNDHHCMAVPTKKARALSLLSEIRANPSHRNRSRYRRQRSLLIAVPPAPPSPINLPSSSPRAEPAKPAKLDDENLAELDAKFESVLPIELGLPGRRLTELISTLRDMRMFHAALVHSFIHCYNLKEDTELRLYEFRQKDLEHHAEILFDKTDPQQPLDTLDWEGIRSQVAATRKCCADLLEDIESRQAELGAVAGAGAESGESETKTSED